MSSYQSTHLPPNQDNSSFDDNVITNTNNNFTHNLTYQYQSGLNNTFQSEASPYINRALPHHRNNPKVCPLGLYAEQLSGTAFTKERCHNRRTWMYRILPSCATATKSKSKSGVFRNTGSFFGHVDLERDLVLDPNPMRWMPPQTPTPTPKNHTNSNNSGTGECRKRVDFVDGIYTMAATGPSCNASGIAIHIYDFDANMRPCTHRNEDQNATSIYGDDSDADSDADAVVVNKYMYNSDGDFLIVPQRQSLLVETELGKIIVSPKEICVVPRGIVFSVNINLHHDAEDIHRGRDRGDGDGDSESESESARGYILEVFEGHFDLPELGPIGSNGLANARDFLIPTAAFDNEKEEQQQQQQQQRRRHVILNKFGNTLFRRDSPCSPFNVVAWHGNYVPFKYNLEHFCAMNSVTYDHPDPSIYTVLTVPSFESGTALADFVIFPPRIMATDNGTFRPPWFHRNCMSEFMGLIEGQYDAKKEGFVPGGCSLHNMMTSHGPDAEAFQAATKKDCSMPEMFDAGIAFMFETKCLLKLTKFAMNSKERDEDYAMCWEGLDTIFCE